MALDEVTESKAPEAKKPTRKERILEAPVKRLLLDRERMALAISISATSFDSMRKLGCPSLNAPGLKRELYDPHEVIAWLKSRREAGDMDELTLANDRRASVLG